MTLVKERGIDICDKAREVAVDPLSLLSVGIYGWPSACNSTILVKPRRCALRVRSWQ